MASAVKPLYGAEGYLRWKESMLLRLQTVGVAHVLSEDSPAAGDAAAPEAAKKWASDDAVCRGHILAAHSDRVFPDREVWQAVARTYDLDMSGVARRRFIDFEFDEGASLLEQLGAPVEALAAAGMKAPVRDDVLAYGLCDLLPEEVAIPEKKRQCWNCGQAGTLRQVVYSLFWIDAERTLSTLLPDCVQAVRLAI